MTVGWMDWFGIRSALGWVSVTIGEYSGALVPALDGAERGGAITVILSFMLLRFLGVRAGTGGS